MSKVSVKVFLCFSVAALLFSVFTTATYGRQTSKKRRSASPTTGSSSKSTDTNAKVDLNTASEKELDNLPGVGSASAKKIIAGRPYSSVGDLSKAGLSASTIKKIAPLVTAGSGAAATTVAASSSATKPVKTADTNAKVDLNTASEKDLDGLPGVGSATAKKIVAGRPYSSVDQLSRAGISASTLKKIAPLVTVSSGAASASGKASPTATQPSPAVPSQPVPASSAKAASSSASQGVPGPGMVWVNLSSGVYHYSGSQFYGKTKNGKYMSEDDAVKAGYHAAKNEKKPQ